MKECYENLLSRNNRQDVLFLGDLNIDMLGNNPSSKLVLEMCTTLGLVSHINIPTRVTMTSESCIDIVISAMSHISHVGVIKSSLSDIYCQKENNNEKTKGIFSRPQL